MKAEAEMMADGGTGGQLAALQAQLLQAELRAAQAEQQRMSDLEQHAKVAQMVAARAVCEAAEASLVRRFVAFDFYVNQQKERARAVCGSHASFPQPPHHSPPSITAHPHSSCAHPICAHPICAHPSVTPLERNATRGRAAGRT